MNYVLFTLLMMLQSVSPDAVKPTDRTIIIDKPAFRLYVVEQENDTVASFPVALGINYGQKQRRGDHRTPDGTFSIRSIEDSSGWEGDASGSDYGPWFMRLSGQWEHVGIHGTNRPESIGTRASLGCVRLHNEDLLKLRQLVDVGTKIIITPDTVAPTFRTIGSRKTAAPKTYKARKSRYGRKYRKVNYTVPAATGTKKSGNATHRRRHHRR